MFYGNAYKNGETAQRFIRHYDLFKQIVCLKKAVSKRTFFCFNAASGTSREDPRTFYSCRRYKLAIKALLSNAQYLYIVDSDV